jgi:hypothetical protein
MYASCHGNVSPPFFLEGKPGRGKTFVVNAICTALRAENHIALIVGSSALAATLYEGGRTAHNLFAIPVTEVLSFSVNVKNTLTFEQDNVALTSSIRPFSYRAELIRAASFIAWDELPAANVAWMDCVDNLCRSLMKTDRCFGGIPFLGIGDFRQVAPVVKGTGCAPALQASVKSSSSWTSFHILKLHTPIRGARDPTYTSVVDDVGENFAEKTVLLDILESVSDTDACLTFLFPPDVLADPLASLKRAFLTPKNINVDEFNNIVLDALPGDECSSFPLHGSNILLTSISDIFYSADAIKEDTEREHDEATPDYLSLQTHNGIPGHLLRLKRGCVCTIMRNLSVRNGLVKNARVVVHNLHRRFIQVQVVDHRSNTLGAVHCIPRIRFEFSPAYSSWTINRIQFPLRLAYACTFNSCVGLTLDKTVIDQRTPVFAHGQLYTALSRVRTRADCRVLFAPDGGPEAVNVVYKDLLL